MTDAEVLRDEARQKAIVNLRESLEDLLDGRLYDSKIALRHALRNLDEAIDHHSQTPVPRMERGGPRDDEN